MGCRKQFCLLWLPRAVDLKVSCSKIPRRAFAGIRTHDPLTIRPRRSTSQGFGGAYRGISGDVRALIGQDACSMNRNVFRAFFEYGFGMFTRSCARGFQSFAAYNLSPYMHPGLPGVLRRFETALLYSRPNLRDIMSGWLLSSRALPPANNRYFILREWVHQYNGRGRVAIDLVSRKSIVGTAASVHGSKAVGVASLEGVSIRWVGDWQFYLSSTWASAPVTRWPCGLIGHLV
jgi:hypothetical protein